MATCKQATLLENAAARICGICTLKCSSRLFSTGLAPAMRLERVHDDVIPHEAFDVVQMLMRKVLDSDDRCPC